MLNDSNLQKKYYDDENRLTVFSNARDVWERDNFFSFLKALKPNSRILEVGSGIGRYTIELLKQGYDVTAVELSDTNVSILEKNIKNVFAKDSEKTKRIHIYKDDILKLNFDEKFDLVFCVNTLHHIVPINITIKKFSSFLKKGGNLLMIEPTPFNPFYYLFFLLYQNWSVEKGVLECTPSNIKFLLKDNGFKNIVISSYNLFPQRLFNKEYLWKFNLFLSRLPILNIFALTKIYFCQKDS